jgi:hypothetical protein
MADWLDGWLADWLFDYFVSTDGMRYKHFDELCKMQVNTYEGKSKKIEIRKSMSTK